MHSVLRSHTYRDYIQSMHIHLISGHPRIVQINPTKSNHAFLFYIIDQNANFRH